jgi:hypothetical protein
MALLLDSCCSVLTVSHRDRMRAVVAGALAIIGAVSGRFYFKEDFNDIAWKERWTARAEPSSLVIADAQAVSTYF